MINGLIDHLTRRIRPSQMAFAAALLLAATSVHAADTVADEGAAAESDVAYLRTVSDTGRSVALELALRSFEPGEEGGPSVTLVGVAHIADRAYYRKLQQILEDFDVVLYESIKPSGTGGARGDTDAERRESTVAAMHFLASLIERCKIDGGAYPTDLTALIAIAVDIDPRVAEFIDTARIDAWGKPIVYHRWREEDAASSYRLVSYAADGAAGGEGEAADITIDQESGIQPLAGAEEDHLQGQLADALNLAFQLDALDYGRPHWRCSDMSFDQLQRAMEQRDLDFEFIEGTLAGTSFSARLAKVLLGVVRFADALLSGAVSDTMKVVLIEMLGDEDLVDLSLNQFDEGFAEVIINQRNQVVIDDLKALRDKETPPRSIAILYGAGHMADLGQRVVEQLGYEPGDEQWNRAIAVDLTRSVVSEREVRQIRFMMRRMMLQMKRAQRAAPAP